MRFRLWVERHIPLRRIWNSFIANIVKAIILVGALLLGLFQVAPHTASVNYETQEVKNLYLNCDDFDMSIRYSDEICNGFPFVISFSSLLSNNLGIVDHGIANPIPDIVFSSQKFGLIGGNLQFSDLYDDLHDKILVIEGVLGVEPSKIYAKYNGSGNDVTISFSPDIKEGDHDIYVSGYDPIKKFWIKEEEVIDGAISVAGSGFTVSSDDKWAIEFGDGLDVYWTYRNADGSWEEEKISQLVKPLVNTLHVSVLVNDTASCVSDWFGTSDLTSTSTVGGICLFADGRQSSIVANFNTVRNTELRTTGDVSFSYSTTWKEYSAKNQNIWFANDSFANRNNELSATLSLQGNDDTVSRNFTVEGAINSATISGSSLLPTFWGWYRENIYVVPLSLVTILLTAFGLLWNGKKNKN